MLQKEWGLARAHHLPPVLQLAMRASCTKIPGIQGKIARGRARTRRGSLQLWRSPEAPMLLASCRRSRRSRPASSECKANVEHAQRIYM
eukprot:1588788-Pleurochrysis_carterae.AAC.1